MTNTSQLRPLADGYDRDTFQSVRQQILNTPGKKDLDGLGRWCLSIPTHHYAALVRLYPDLIASERAVRDAAWKWFMASDVSLPYRVVQKI